MRLKQGLTKLNALLPRTRKGAAELDEAQRTFRYIFRYLTIGSDKRYLPKRRQPNAIVLQMAKVASTSIQAALRDRGINAFHSHGLSSAYQHAKLSELLETDLSIPLVGGEMRRHILNVGLLLLTRWYQSHKQYRGAKLKVVTLTRDPVTHYASGLVQRRKLAMPGIADWQRRRLELPPGSPIDEGQAIADLVLEAASIIVEGRASRGPAAYESCVAQARARWPEHPIVARELGSWFGPLVWFDQKMTPLLGIDMLSAPEFRAQGWAERSNDWAEILLLRYEDLSRLMPELQRFFSLPEFALPRRNISSEKRGGVDMKRAVQAALDTEIGRACARELRLTPYARACGYDASAKS